MVDLAVLWIGKKYPKPFLLASMHDEILLVEQDVFFRNFLCLLVSLVTHGSEDKRASQYSEKNSHQEQLQILLSMALPTTAAV